MPRMFASLSVPNYARYFIGVLTSNVGSWMARTAITWLVLVELTKGDMQALGILTGVMFLPNLIVGPFAGTLADRLPKLRILTFTQCVMLLDALVLGTLVVTGHIQFWHVLLITFIDGCAGAMDAPARMAFVSEIVPSDLLPNAIGLGSASFNGARLLGPAIAGVLIAVVGTGPVLFINAVAFGVLILAIRSLDQSRMRHTAAPPAGRGGLREALRYVRRRPDLLLLLGVGMMMGNFGFNFAITNPIMSSVVFGRGPTEFGMLGSLMGVGALAAALLSASRKPRIRHVLAGLLLFVVVNLASGLAPTFETFALLQIPMGLAAITTLVVANTLVQTSVADQVRGRVMALWFLVLLGLTPVVGPLVGWVGTVLGPRWTVQVGTVAIGATFVVVLGYLLAHDKIRLRLRWAGLRPRVAVMRPFAEPDAGPRG